MDADGCDLRLHPPLSLYCAVRVPQQGLRATPPCRELPEHLVQTKAHVYRPFRLGHGRGKATTHVHRPELLCHDPLLLLQRDVHRPTTTLDRRCRPHDQILGRYMDYSPFALSLTEMG